METLGERFVAKRAAQLLVEVGSGKFILKHIGEKTIVEQHKWRVFCGDGTAESGIVEGSLEQRRAWHRGHTLCGAGIGSNVIDEFVGIVEAVVATIGGSDKPGILHVADRFGPSETPVDAVAPAVVVVDLVNVVVLGRSIGEGVSGHRRTVFVHIAEVVAELCAIAASGVAFELVVIHELTAKLIALAIVHI